MGKKTLLMVLLAGLLVGACGDGDDVGETGSPTSALAPVTTVVASPTTTSGSGSTSSTPPTTRSSGPALTAASTLDLRGLGPVRVGMTLAEATAAAGVPIVGPGGAECTYAKAEGGPEDVLFMVIGGRIVRVDVREGSPVKSLSGAGVGDTETQVQALYANRLQVTPHKYDPTGHYLTLVPTDPSDSGYRLIFETDGSKVTQFRSGQVPEVEQVEGCS